MATYRVQEIEDGFYILRVNDRYTNYFEALWEIPEGITYNAYLLKTSEGAVLFDGWKKVYSSQLIDALETVIGPEELRYVVVNHLEPDHSGSLEDVLRWAPNAKVLGSRLAARLIKAFPRARERFQAVGDGEALELGGERIRFIYTPWLHWPETMVSWVETRRILVTCDAFGGYGIPFGLFDDECIRWEDALRAMQKYVVTVIGHYRGWIVKALDKLHKAGIKPRIIAPAHGLMWRKDPGYVMRFYERLARGTPVKGKALVVYGSMYGTVENMVRRLVCAMAREGYSPVVYGFTDSKRPQLSEILTDAIDSEVILIAAPTYEADLFPLIRLVAEEICWKASDGKKAVIVSSYGWGSMAARRLREILEGCNFSVVESIEYNSVGPAGLHLAEVEELAKKVVEALKKGGEA
ncbi:MAG: FprA family A-type flavoprotein [Desulfurococcales archaeon]|nr:FprA family A-type flavoprotein [Desulfurococcales archaeon]